MSIEVHTVTVEATQAIGVCLASVRPERAIVYLEGELGAGKTTLVRGFISACGHTGVVKSPTYTLVEPYELGVTRIFHFDLYRLNDPEELEFIAARELFAAGLCFIEWPSRGSGVLPVADVTMRLSHQAKGRVVQLTADTRLGQDWLEGAEPCLTQIIKQ